MKHSKYSASALYRLLNCPASVRFVNNFSVGTEYADRGSSLHEEAEKCLREGVESTNPVVKYYIDYITQAYEEVVDGSIYIEKMVNYASFLDLPECDAWGTSDCIIYDRQTKTIEVIDYKTGGSYVGARQNPQLMAYALGTLNLFENYHDEVKFIKMTIVQPAINSISSHAIMLSELLSFAEFAKKRIKETETFSPSGFTCKFCPGRRICPSLSKYVLDSSKDKIKLLKESAFIQEYLDNARKETIEEIKQGNLEGLQGFYISRQNRVKWTKKIDEGDIKHIKDKYGSAAIRETLKPISQVRNFLTGKDFKRYTEKTEVEILKYSESNNENLKNGV